MNEHTYKKIEIIGCSSESIESAVRNATIRAGESLRDLRWFEVNEIRGKVSNGDVTEWQVGLKLAFTLEDQVGATQGAEKTISDTFAATPEGIAIETRPRKNIASKPAGDAE